MTFPKNNNFTAVCLCTSVDRGRIIVVQNNFIGLSCERGGWLGGVIQSGFVLNIYVTTGQLCVNFPDLKISQISVVLIIIYQLSI